MPSLLLLVRQLLSFSDLVHPLNMWIYCSFIISTVLARVWITDLVAKSPWSQKLPQTVFSPTSTEHSHTTPIFTGGIPCDMEPQAVPSWFRNSPLELPRLTTSPRSLQTAPWAEHPPNILFSTHLSRAFSPSYLSAPLRSLSSFHGAIFATDAGSSEQATRSR